MKKNYKRELVHVNECIQGRLSVQKLCEKLNVSSAGLGHRLIRLLRTQYDKEHGQAE